VKAGAVKVANLISVEILREAIDGTPSMENRSHRFGEFCLIMKNKISLDKNKKDKWDCLLLAMDAK